VRFFYRHAEVIIIEIKIVKIGVPKDCNLVIGQAHFIKTVEDLHETLAETIPNAKFGLAFCESSGPCLVRSSGNDAQLKAAAEKAGMLLSAGHCFVVILRGAYPVSVLNRIKSVSEVCNIYCATANPVEIIIVETEQGRGILGVIDGFKSRGVETEKDVQDRKALLRKIGYKL